MKISVFGLGYVGAVAAGCLAARDHTVVGVDIAPSKVEALKAGRAPIIEPGLEERLTSALGAGRLSATTDAAEAVAASEVSMICVGTPSSISGGLDLRFVRHVTGQILEALRAGNRPHALVFRSTMLPGSTREILRDVGSDLVSTGRVRAFYQPEFLREGSAVGDFEDPSLQVVGTEDGDPPPAALKDLFGKDVAVVRWESAELLKYACNAFHAAKITFANEMGRLGKVLGVDAAGVMELLTRDTRLNISRYYLRPGNPFGGSCLPKDVRAVAHRARQLGVGLPLVESLLPSNERHLQSLLELIAASGQREVILLGLAFKAHTDDLRESAMVEVAQHCLGRGYKVRIFDPALNVAALVGANKRDIDIRMPHLASLLHNDLGLAVGSRGLLVASQPVAPVDLLAAVVTSEHAILDLNGWPELRALNIPYEGFCW